MVKTRAVDTQASHLKPLDLIATTVHELKTPLTLIMGLASMLEAGQFGDLKPQQSRYVGRINNVSERLLVLVESLLTLSRSEGRLALQLQPVSVGAIIQTVLEELDPTIIHNRIQVNWTKRHGVEPVLADRDCLYQIVYNLVDNSLKYSPPKTTITIKFRQQTGWLYLRISDQGMGVKPTELKHLFRRFGKVSQPISTQAGSSGLGLYIVKRLVEVQGGKIRVQTLKQGTCFIVQLPVARQLDLFGKAPSPKKAAVKMPAPLASSKAKAIKS